METGQRNNICETDPAKLNITRASSLRCTVGSWYQEYPWILRNPEHAATGPTQQKVGMGQTPHHTQDCYSVQTYNISVIIKKIMLHWQVRILNVRKYLNGNTYSNVLPATLIPQNNTSVDTHATHKGVQVVWSHAVDYGIIGIIPHQHPAATSVTKQSVQ